MAGTPVPARNTCTIGRERSHSARSKSSSAAARLCFCSLHTHCSQQTAFRLATGLYNFALSIPKLRLDPHAFRQLVQGGAGRLCRKASSTDQRTVQGPKVPLWPDSPSCQSTAAGFGRKPRCGRGCQVRGQYQRLASDERPRTTTAPSPSTSYRPPAWIARGAARSRSAGSLLPGDTNPTTRNAGSARFPASRAWLRRRSPRPSDRGCAGASPDPEIPGNAQTRRAGLCELHRPLRPEIAEERKWPRRAPLLAHEQHWDLRQQQIDRRYRTYCFGRCEIRHPIAERPIADLIVVLNERDKSSRRQAGARCASRSPAIGHQLALECEALRESAAQFLRIALVIGV